VRTLNRMNALRLFLVGMLVLVPVAAAEAPTGEAQSVAECSQTSTGLIPLTDLGKRMYRGQKGGLYPGGLNTPPRWYLKAGVSAAKRVHPINGRTVVLSIGMSNATLEFRSLMRQAAGDTEVNPAVTLVDGALHGWDAQRVARPAAGYWSAVDRRLKDAGVTAGDVQVVWLKEAISGEARPFPQDAKALRSNLRTIVQIVTRRFPKLRLIYTSSRTYGGYAITPTNPEPAAYDSGYAVRWLIQDRMEKKLRGPWIGWGPYLWTDGAKGRIDGFTWACEDVRDDGTLPSGAGATKVGRQLLRFFKSDPTTKSWFAITS
jgi:hypothetical protein